MRADILQITDMVNIKLRGMFELINNWGPANNTIKSTLLKDIQHIQNELTTLNINERTTSRSMKPKCRNGDSCWYLKQGRCWFAHDLNGTNCNVIADRQVTPQSRANITTPTGNNSTSNRGNRENRSTNAKPNMKVKKEKQKINNNSNSNNMCRKKKNPNKRIRKRKKQPIDKSSQDKKERKKIFAANNSSNMIYPTAVSRYQANRCDNGNFSDSQIPNEEIGDAMYNMESNKDSPQQSAQTQSPDPDPNTSEIANRDSSQELFETLQQLAVKQELVDKMDRIKTMEIFSQYGNPFDGNFLYDNSLM